MNAVCEGHQCVNIVFDRIIMEPGWDNDAIAQAMALKQKLQDFKFMFLLDVSDRFLDTLMFCSRFSKLGPLICDGRLTT